MASRTKDIKIKYISLKKQCSPGVLLSMDTAATVLGVDERSELYALRKKVFLGKFLKIDSGYWNLLEKHGTNVNGSPITLTATILEKSYACRPDLVLSELNKECRDLDLAGMWDQCVKSTQDLVDFHVGCHSDSSLFGDIG